MNSATQWIYYFSDPPTDDDPVALRDLLGGKGAALKEMSRAGLAVPPGFTISTDCCRAYFERQHRWPEKLAEQLRDNLSRLQQDTGRTFGRGRKPLLLSVRSGAAVSMPGMMDTLLNCGLHPGLADDCRCGQNFWAVYRQFIRMFARVAAGLDPAVFDRPRDEPVERSMRESALADLETYERAAGRPIPTEPWECLVECVNAVFESWHNDRAIAYRKRNHIEGLRGTAVNIQAMFPSQVSGIVFTRDPANVKSTKMLVEASYGLGEAIVSGQVDPDCFCVDRDNLSIDAQIGEKRAATLSLGHDAGDPDRTKAALDNEQITHLAQLALQVEAFYGHPVDLEFGYADGRFALLQSRPIRGLHVAEDAERVRVEEIDRLRQIAAGDRRCWVAHNLGETLRFPTPMTWDIMSRFMSGTGGFGRMYRMLGYRPSRRVHEQGFLELILGRVYADPTRLADLFWDRMPLAYDVEALVDDRSLLDRAPTRFDPQKCGPDFLLHLPGTVWAMLKCSRTMQAMENQVRDRFEQQILPAYLDYIREGHSQDLAELSDSGLIAELRSRCRRVLDEFGAESLLPGFFGGLAYERLTSMLAQLMGEQEGRRTAMTLVRGLDTDMTVRQSLMLHDVARGRATLPDFLDRFGHRCVNEMELAEPRWRQDPSYPQMMVEQFAAERTFDPSQVHDANVTERNKVEKGLPGLLRHWGGTTFGESIRHNIHLAQTLLPYRETGKHYLMMGYELIRLCLEELGRRWDLQWDIYFLKMSELDAFSHDSDSLRESIRNRKLRHKAVQRLDAPDVIESGTLETLGLIRECDMLSEYESVPISPGAATGVARIVRNPNEKRDVGRDCILVCPSTDPGWTPLLMQAAALVVERGGVLSHGAIVARDFGIPAVVCANATRLLQDGQKIRVDGNTGTIGILER